MSIPPEAANSGSSHISIAEGSLVLKCLWKVGLPLQLKPGNQLSSGDAMGCMELCSNCCAENCVPLDLRLVSQGISGVANEVMILVVYDVESRIDLEPVQGYRASSCDNMGYT